MQKSIRITSIYSRMGGNSEDGYMLCHILGDKIILSQLLQRWLWCISLFYTYNHHPHLPEEDRDLLPEFLSLDDDTQQT